MCAFKIKEIRKTARLPLDDPQMTWFTSEKNSIGKKTKNICWDGGISGQK